MSDWVELRAIQCEKTRKQWMQDFLEMDGFDWPTYKMMRDILNNTDEDTKIFHGHRPTGWMHWKDVVTSVIRRIKDRRAGLKTGADVEVLGYAEKPRRRSNRISSSFQKRPHIVRS